MVVKTLVAVAALFLFAGCDWRQQETLIATDENITPVQVDLADIRQRGKLVAITGFNPLSYFIYKGTPMGYDYELLKMFAEENDIELELLVVHDLDSVFHLLNNGKGDIIGYGMNITKEGRRKAAYAQPFMQVHQVLVQRKPETGPDKNGMGNTDALIRDIKGLAGKSVHVKGNSVQMDRLFRLIEEIGVEIDIVPLKGDMSADDLIRKVAEKEIDYTVADENAARLASTYFSNIDVETFVSDAEGLSWAVRRNSPELLHALNDWFTRIQKTEQYNLIYKKYFTSKRQFAKWAGSDYYFSQGRGKISEFDEIIKRHAQRIGWD